MQEGKKLRIQKLTDFLTGLGQEIKEYDEQMVRRYIDVKSCTLTSKKICSK